MLTLKIVKITYLLAGSNATCALTHCQITCQHLQHARGPHTTHNDQPTSTLTELWETIRATFMTPQRKIQAVFCLQKQFKSLIDGVVTLSLNHQDNYCHSAKRGLQRAMDMSSVNLFLEMEKVKKQKKEKAHNSG